MNETELIGNEIYAERRKTSIGETLLWVAVGIAILVAFVGLAYTHSLPFLN